MKYSIKNKDDYLTARAAWRAVYNYVSDEIRTAKLKRDFKPKNNRDYVRQALAQHDASRLRIRARTLMTDLAELKSFRPQEHNQRSRG